MVDIGALTVGTRYAINTIQATAISSWASSYFHRIVVVDFGVLPSDCFPLLANAISSWSVACFTNVANNSRMCFGLTIVSLRTMFNDSAAHIVRFSFSTDLIVEISSESNFLAL